MLNLKKTKIMTTQTLKEFILEGTEMEITNCSTFLGSVITRDGYDYKELNRRMVITKLEKIMKDQDIKKATKIKIAEMVIFPAVTYGSESWTVRKKERKKIDAFVLWTRRKILRVPWTEKRKNFFSFGESETQKITRSNNPPIKATIFWPHYESRSVTRAGHYAWTSHRRQGKPWMRWLDSIKEATGLRLDALKETVQDRKKW
jgi:hypothetical protein